MVLGKVCSGFSIPLLIFRGLRWGGGGVLQYNNGLAQKCITLSSRSVQLDSANTNEINLDKHLVFTLFI